MQRRCGFNGDAGLTAERRFGNGLVVQAAVAGLRTLIFGWFRVLTEAIRPASK